MQSDLSHRNRDTESTTARARESGRRKGLTLLFVIHSLRGGGAGRVCAALANGLSARGHRVTVAVNYSDESIWHDQFNDTVEMVYIGAGHARRSIRPLTNLVERIRPEVVLAFNYQLAIAMLAVRNRAMRNGVPRFRLVSRHIVAASDSMGSKGIWQRVFVRSVVKRLYRRVDLVIAQSAGMFDDLVRNFNIPESKARTIFNPVLPVTRSEELGLTEPLADRLSRAKNGAKHGALLLYLGRFKPQKQPMLLLDVLARVREHVPNAILAAGGNGPLVKAFQEAARDRDLDDDVFYLGYVMNPASLFEHAAVTVLTSAYEGFPNVLIDSISKGVPVVSFDCPTGPSEIVEPGTNGYLVPPGDIDDFAAKVVRLLKEPPDPEMVKKSASRFSLERAIDQYEAALRG